MNEPAAHKKKERHKGTQSRNRKVSFRRKTEVVLFTFISRLKKRNVLSCFCLKPASLSLSQMCN